MSRRSSRLPEHDGADNNSAQQAAAEAALYRQLLEQHREEFQAFAYSVSHDLRAPLRAIEGFSKILAEDFSKELGEDGIRFLKHIVTNTQLLGSQIEDLLRFYRAGKNPPTKIQVDASKICLEALSALAAPVPKNVTLQHALLPAVHADPLQLREIFVQLIENALKATRNAAEPRIEIGATEEPAAITFFVRDNGIGFDPKNAGELFNVFQKLHPPSDFPGNGVGLAIMKRLVTAQGGCVSADSEPGKGSIFCFSLPKGQERVTEPPHCAASHKS